MIWNPNFRPQHAWDSATTPYGKIALILFYPLIWMGIISSLITIFAPLSQGCIPDTLYETDDQREGIAVFIRLVNLVWVGFYIYAVMGKLKVPNVTIVAIVLCVYSVLILPLMDIIEKYGCESMKQDMWVLRIWAMAALIFTLLDEKLGNGYTDV